MSSLQKIDSQDSGWFMFVLISIFVLLVGNLIYPDVATDTGLHLGGVRISPLGILFVVTAPQIAFYAWNRRQEIEFRSLDLFLLAAMAFILLRGELAQTTTNGRALVLAYVLYALLLYYGMAVLGQRKTAYKTMIVVFVCLGLLEAGYALIEFVLKENVIYGGIIKESAEAMIEKGYHRSGSSFVLPGALGLFLVQVAPFFIYCFVKGKKASKMAAWGAATILVALALEATLTKGVWAAAIVLAAAGIIWVLVYEPSLRKPVMVMAISVSLAATAMTFFFSDTVDNGIFSLRRQNESFLPRYYMLEKAPSTFMANPILGTGLWQGVSEVFYLHQDNIDWGRWRPKAFDDLYITFLVEQGILGAALAAAAFFLIFREAWKLLRKRGAFFAYALPVVMSMIAIFLVGFTSDTVFIWPAAVIFWLEAGQLRAMVELDRNGKCFDRRVANGA